MRMSSSTEKVLAELRKAAIDKVEWHGDVWTDNVWTVTLERHPYGTIRMWITREDKSGKYQSDICNVYRVSGELRYACEIKLAKHVINKVFAIYKRLEEIGLVQ